MKFSIRMIHQGKELVKLHGVRDAELITLKELEEVIPTEQFLERLLGIRVHIQEERS